ncbi:hypothetical protein [Lysobacter soli]|uniref:hypothetical protein n=1 Tax=Lysobacter soli TaxID=453783 RepID=UPI003CCE4F82
MADDAGDVVGYIGQSSQAFVRLANGVDTPLNVRLDATGLSCTLAWKPDPAGGQAGELRHGEGSCHAR